MNRRFVGLGAIVLVAVSGTSELWAADEAGKPEASAAASIDDAARKADAERLDRLACDEVSGASVEQRERPVPVDGPDDAVRPEASRAIWRPAWIESLDRTVLADVE